jgi:hypothetical protein
MQKAYRIYIPEKRAVICSVHVHFDENRNMGDKFQAEGEFSSNIIPSSLHSRNSNLMIHLVIPS